MTKLALDKAALAGKSPDEQLIASCEQILVQLEKSALDRDNELISKLTRQVEDQQAAFEKRISERFPNFSLPGVETGQEKKESYSLSRAVMYVATRDASMAPYEVACNAELRKKAMSFGIDSAGGFLVPTEVMSGIIDKLQPMVVSFGLGVRQIDGGNASPIRRNRKTGTTTAEWVGEMATAAKTQLVLAQMELSPKALSARADVSNLLQRLSPGTADQMLADDFAQQFALATDKAILLGAPPIGPVGVANTPGKLTSTTASLDYDKLVDFELELAKANALFGNVGWAVSVSQYGLIYKLKDASGQPLMLRNVQSGGPNLVLGYPIAKTTQLGTTGANTVIMGNWAQAMFVRWFGGMELIASNTSDTAIDSDVTRVAARMYGDVGVEQPTAFCVASA